MSQLHTWAKLLGGEVCSDQVRCPGPGHTAKDRSLSVTIGKDGQPMVYLSEELGARYRVISSSASAASAEPRALCCAAMTTGAQWLPLRPLRRRHPSAMRVIRGREGQHRSRARQHRTNDDDHTASTSRKRSIASPHRRQMGIVAIRKHPPRHCAGRHWRGFWRAWRRVLP